MQFKYIIVYLAIWTFAFATATEDLTSEDEGDNVSAESKLIQSFAALTPGVASSGSLDDLGTYPYEDQHAVFNNYGAPPVPQPSFGIAVNTQGILAPHVEVLRLVEAFIKLKGEILARFYALLNDNWELIRAVLNLIIGKLQNLHAFSLKGISVFRKIMEFALNLFSDWSITLPSLTFGATQGAYPQPQSTYGVPSAGNIATFLEAFATK